MNNQTKKFMDRQAKTASLQAKEAADTHREMQGHISLNVELRRQELEAVQALARTAEFQASENRRLNNEVFKMRVEIDELRNQMNLLITGGYSLLNTQQVAAAKHDGWPTALHRYRADRIRELQAQGLSYEISDIDPQTKEEWEAAGLSDFYPGDDEDYVAVDVDDVEVKLPTARRGPKPIRYKEAKALLEASTTNSGRIGRWSGQTVEAAITVFSFENPDRKIVCSDLHGTILNSAYQYCMRNKINFVELVKVNAFTKGGEKK